MSATKESKPTTIYKFESNRDFSESMRTLDDPYLSSESPVKRPLVESDQKRESKFYPMSQSMLERPQYGSASMYSFIDSKSKDSLLRMTRETKNPTPATLNRRLLAASTNKNWCPFIA